MLADYHIKTAFRQRVLQSEYYFSRVAAKALNYEVMDMQRYISQGHDDGQLSLSQDVAHILNQVRDN